MALKAGVSAICMRSSMVIGRGKDEERRGWAMGGSQAQTFPFCRVAPAQNSRWWGASKFKPQSPRLF